MDREICRTTGGMSWLVRIIIVLRVISISMSNIILLSIVALEKYVLYLLNLFLIINYFLFKVVTENKHHIN